MKDDLRQSRRRLLKTVAGAGGVYATGKMLPGRWASPVVDSVLLPTHGQMTGMYVRSAGAAAEDVALGIGPRNRIARLFSKLFPAAYANGVDEVYVCVSPNDDGTKADIRVYEIYEGPKECGYEPISINRFTANDVDVPSTNNTLVDEGDECAEAGIGKILEKLGIVRPAYALVTRKVDISSVENGAKGVVKIDANMWPFDIEPGTCSPPSCGCAP